MKSYELEQVFPDYIHHISQNEEEKIKDEIKKNRVMVIDIDFTSNLQINETEFFKKCANAMKFPDYFGHNWDAFDECLRDLDSWMPRNKGYVLFLKGARKLLAHAPQVTIDFISIALSVAESFDADKKLFHLVFVF